MMSVKDTILGIGDHFLGVEAIVRHSGFTQFADGIWLGLEFASPVGRNNGSVKGLCLYHFFS